MNGKPGDAVINFAMQKKIQGTPLDAAIYFKKEKIIFYLKNLERFPEFKLDYYTEKKNQASPEYAAYQQLLGKTEPVVVSLEKKFQTKDDVILELRQALVAKDQIILDQNVKIEELQKEIEALKTAANKPAQSKFGGSSATNSPQNEKGPNTFVSLRKGSTGPSNVAKGDPPKFKANSSDDENKPNMFGALKKTSATTTSGEPRGSSSDGGDEENKPNMFGALKKTTGPRPSNEQPSNTEDDKPALNAFATLKKTAGPKVVSEQPEKKEEPQVFFQLRKASSAASDSKVTTPPTEQTSETKAEAS